MSTFQSQALHHLIRSMGPAAAEEFLAKFGGTTVHIPSLDNSRAKGMLEAAHHSPLLHFCIKSRVDEGLHFRDAVDLLASIAMTAAHLSGATMGITVEIETRGMGDAYIEALRAKLMHSWTPGAPLPEVVGVSRIQDNSGGAA